MASASACLLAAAAAIVLTSGHNRARDSALTSATGPASNSAPASPARPAGSASPSPAHRARPARHRARRPGPAVTSPASHAAPAARSARKGVGAWSFNGVSTALSRSGAAWYYTWSVSHQPIATPPGTAFVPMIWGPGSVTSAALSQAKGEGRYLLGFNEPDMSSQSDMSVPQALSLWPKLMATGMRLGSPAVATGAATPGGWLDQFMHGAAARGYRVNFITVHWYGADFTTSDAVQQLHDYLAAIHARYHLPIWLTEFALIRFGSTTTFPSPQQQAAFVSAAASMLDHLPYLQRYAWFALPASAGDGSAGLFRAGPAATAAGRAFEAAS